MNGTANINQGNKKQANAAQRYKVSRSDLPVHCPMEDMATWDSHPMVYLPIEEQGGEAKCPYCGAVYELKD